ncbi:hypothetical protein [Dissulfurimicrobium hydrothermale]|uniref:hypothetical protein n=1 Tax=Dissulfurimicrobium hydrothermale TaxID=1750598 RepID=UPI001EDC4FAD|nr:hypothetical protein [Dissulfurimicrobium hydrothermale]UKL13361.1 hypothetical protein LGS26_07695 [Dissulfurimicrobium hydrothermale]
MENSATTKAKVREDAGLDIASAGFEKEISKITLAAGGIMAGLVGIWGITCLAAGLIAAGGPVELAKAWFSAVTGG